MDSPAPSSEKDASHLASTSVPMSTPALGPKLRSCLVCRSRKVRCDKQSPCQNCRRAKIPCVLPTSGNPPRWARRLQHHTDNAAIPNAPTPQETDASVDKAMDRLRNLEDLVKELRGQLEQSQATSASTSPGHPTQNPETERQQGRAGAGDATGLHQNFGRLVLRDAGRSRYVTSAFWSRVDDELDGLRMHTQSPGTDEVDSSEDDASPGITTSTQELDRSPSDRHSFLFQHNLSPAVADLREFQPMPSQVPFLLEAFSENVNVFIMTVHIPSLTKMVRDSRGNTMARLTPSNEALLFSVYYAAIISMEEDDVQANFNSSKADLSLKFRLGLEHALAKADFLNAPDVVLVQAFATFLCLVRRHDSPRFVYMMAGLVIRMAQFLGLQRDGANFEHFTPFEVEMRRRIWWTICSLDLRASEDQGMDITISSGSFDTKIPSNLNESDIDPDSRQIPTERYGVTDMSFALVSAGMTDVMRQMMANNAENSVAGLEEQRRLLNEIYQKLEHGYLKHVPHSGNIKYWVAVTVARLIMAKMRLIVSLPVLFSSPSEHISEELRTKLLVSAIEVAEYNHALNAEEACRQWRWVYQSHTHWHAIVFLLIELSRRSWSPIIERAWAALQSPWLIPVQTHAHKTSRIWIPLRKLMAKTAKHREAELERLRAEPEAIARLEAEDQKVPLPSSEWIFSTGSNTDNFRVRWRQLVGRPKELVNGTQTSGYRDAQFATQVPATNQSRAAFAPAFSSDDSRSNMTMEPTYPGAMEQQFEWSQGNANLGDPNAASATNSPNGPAAGQGVEPFYNPHSTGPTGRPDGGTAGPGSFPWLWADADPSVEVFTEMDMGTMDADMDYDGEVNWLNFLESAKDMQWGARQ